MMTTTTQDWFSAMTLKLSHLDEQLPRSVDWRQSLFTMQLRVVGFAYHRDKFTDFVSGPLEIEPPKGEPGLVLTPAGASEDEALSLNAALATAELLAAAQSLYAACGTLFRVARCALGLELGGDASGAAEISMAEVGKLADCRSKVAIENLRSSKEFQYLDGLLKLSKHKSHVLVRPHQILASGPGRAELLIREFHFETASSVCSFKSKWATEFLHVDCERVIELCNRLGETLVNEMV